MNSSHARGVLASPIKDFIGAAAVSWGFLSSCRTSFFSEIKKKNLHVIHDQSAAVM